MGCFSFLCTECGQPINSDSFSGEHARLAILVDGEAIEEMQGEYDSYGRVFDDQGESKEWEKDWSDVCNIMFDSNPRSGMSAAHVACIHDNHVPTKVSVGDDDQGWGKYNPRHTLGKCEHYHKVF